MPWRGRARLAENRYKRIERLFVPLMVGIVVAIIASVLLCVAVGEVSIPVDESYRILLYKLFGIGQPESSNAMMSIIWKARVPRILMALCVGAGLALCGVAMQSSVQNPLADPYILGASSGASLGATFAIMAGLGGVSWANQLGVSTSAFIGSMGASLLVLVIAGVGGRMTSVKLVLGGTVLNMVCSTFTTLIVYLFPDADGMQTVSYWLMGSLAGVGYKDLTYLPAVIAVAIVFFHSQSRVMNTMVLGDATANTLGVNTSAHRVVYMITSSLLIAIMVTKCGIIGYVGLIIPHIARGFVGSDHRKLVPFAACLGALFLLWCDLLSRSVLGVFGRSGELPIGLITSAIGAPLLLYRIIRQGFTSGDGH